jgi:hypothetical protein
MGEVKEIGEVIGAVPGRAFVLFASLRTGVLPRLLFLLDFGWCWSLWERVCWLLFSAESFFRRRESLEIRLVRFFDAFLVITGVSSFSLITAGTSGDFWLKLKDKLDFMSITLPLNF